MYTKTSNSNLYILCLLIFFNINFFSIKAQTYSLCKGDSISLDIASYRGNLQWQESNDNISWNDITGATYQPYIIKVSGTKYYRAKVTDANCNPVYSGFKEIYINPMACKYFCGHIGTFVDERDGQTYGYVELGSQTWMMQNLNIGTRINRMNNQSDNAIIEKYCYNDDENNCSIYGGLYQWNEMMQYDTTETARGICPDGWHIPSDIEWRSLVDSLNGANVAGANMKETGTVHWNKPNEGANNTSCLTVLPGGSCDQLTFYDLGFSASFWDSSHKDETDAWYHAIFYDNKVVLSSFFNKAVGMSVRCLKD